MNQYFDPAQVAAAVQMAEAAVQSNAIVDNGLTSLSRASERDPIAWIDDLGQVWPHEPGAPVHAHLQYCYTREEVQDALAQSRGIIVVSTVPSSVVPQVTGEAPPPAMPDASPASAVKAARSRQAMLATFANPAGLAVRSE